MREREEREKKEGREKSAGLEQKRRPFVVGVPCLCPPQRLTWRNVFLEGVHLFSK